MKKSIIIVLFLTINFVLSGQVKDDSQLVETNDIGYWVAFLSSDDMKGRLNGSPEMEEASVWLSERFKEFGIKAFEDYPDYIQEYSFSRRDISVNERNVIGYIEGSDPELKDEFIIISAHFDHVGIRRVIDGDSIYNGADDNAAGTATLLGVAKGIKLSGKSPGRSIIFASVSGEEMGMQGSRYFVQNSPIPISSLYANVNFEMTGHSEELGKGKYYMTGCSYSNLDNLIAEFGRETSITLVDTIAIADTRLFFMSDNISFSRVRQEEDIMYGIPSSTFATSTTAPHIHTPKDELVYFDFDNMTNLVNYFSKMVVWLSNCEEPVEWTSSRFKRIE